MTTLTASPSSVMTVPASSTRSPRSWRPTTATGSAARCRSWPAPSAGIVVVTLPEGRAADFTAAVQALPDLTIVVHDVDAAEAEEPDSRSITVELLGNDRPGLVRELTAVFAEHGLSIEEIETGSYEAPMAGGRLFEALLVVPVPKGTDADALRADLGSPWS